MIHAGIRRDYSRRRAINPFRRPDQQAISTIGRPTRPRMGPRRLRTTATMSGQIVVATTDEASDSRVSARARSMNVRTSPKAKDLPRRHLPRRQRPRRRARLRFLDRLARRPRRRPPANLASRHRSNIPSRPKARRGCSSVASPSNNQGSPRPTPRTGPIHDPPSQSLGHANPAGHATKRFARRIRRLPDPARPDHRRRSTIGTSQQASLASRRRRTKPENHHAPRPANRPHPDQQQIETQF